MPFWGKIRAKIQGRKAVFAITLSDCFEQNVALFDRLYQGDDTIVKRQFRSGGDKPFQCCIFYCDGMVNNQIINENIIRPVTLCRQEGQGLDWLARQVLQINELKSSRDVEDIVQIGRAHV